MTIHTPWRIRKPLVSIVRERRWTFAFTSFIAAAAAVFVIHSEPRMYQAQALVEIADQTPATQIFGDSSIAEAAEKMNADDPASWWDRTLPRTPSARLAAIKQHLRIEEASNHAVWVRFEWSDPHLAAGFTNALIQSCIAERRQSIERGARNLQTRISEIEARLIRDLSELRTAAPGSADTELLRVRVAANRRLYAALLDRRNDTAPEPDSGIHVITAAQVPAEPYRGGLALQMFAGILGATALGLAASVIREKTDTTVRTPEETFGPVLGTVPRAHRESGSPRDSSYVERIAWEAKDAEEAEAFRAVLASLLASPEPGMRTLLITSPRAEEGKTTVAGNLAIVLAGIQRRVLLVDADLRRPRLHAIFEVANTSGLGDLLCASASVLDLPAEQLVKKTTIPNLSLLSSGPGTDGIFNRLYSARMAQLLARFRDQFDHVIVDAPPALEVADARALARWVDGVLVVLRAGRSDKRDAAAVFDQVTRDGTRLVGTVLNDWPWSRRDYRYRRSYGYHAARDAEASTALNSSIARG